MPSGIFITARNHIEGRTGGVQVCTREYVETIKTAGIDLRFCLSDGDRRLSTRVLRRVVSSKYFRAAEPNIVAAAAHLSAEISPDFLFLNQVALASLAPRLRPYLPSFCKIVALSHGLESTDLLHLIRLKDRLPLTGSVRPTNSIALGNTILAEIKMRQHLDVVCALSSFDVQLERWVGARHVGWLPRIVEPDPINWRPLGTRLGFMGTLNHAPNLEGLVAILDQLVLRNDIGELRIRVVGEPSTTGMWLAKNYPIVQYLGRLEEAELRVEAETWNAFLNPIFCNPRGCSTKLASAIAWCIPVITTPAGHRGYHWREGKLIVAMDAVQFACKCIEVCDGLRAKMARAEVIKVSRSSPSRQEVAAKFKELINV